MKAFCAFCWWMVDNKTKTSLFSHMQNIDITHGYNIHAMYSYNSAIFIRDIPFCIYHLGSFPVISCAQKISTSDKS